MTAAERLYLARTGEAAAPPRWDDHVGTQEAESRAQSCAFVAERNSREGRHARAARWALSSLLWRYRAEYLADHPPASTWAQVGARHQREALRQRSSSSAIRRFLHEHPNTPARTA